MQKYLIYSMESFASLKMSRFGTTDIFENGPMIEYVQLITSSRLVPFRNMKTSYTIHYWFFPDFSQSDQYSPDFFNSVTFRDIIKNTRILDCIKNV
jgi:hypothetical protein